MEFVVEGKSIHAHKMLLILRCDYFRSMFSEGAWKESKERLVETTEACMKKLINITTLEYLALIPCMIQISTSAIS